MGASLSEFEIIIRAATEQAEAQIKGLAKSIGDTAHNISISWDDFNHHMERSNQLMATLIETAKYFIGVEFAKSIWDASVNLQRLENGFEAIKGTSTGAKEEIDFLRQTSDRLGLSFEAVSQGYLRMAASSKGTALEGEQTRKIFLGLSEAATVLDMSADQTRNLFDAVSVMMSKGTITAQDLRRRLGTDLPGAMNIMAEALGVSTQELNRMMEAGQLTADVVLPKLAEALHQKYSAAAVKASQDALSAFNRFKNALLELEENIANSGALQAVTDAMKALSAQFKDPALQQSISLVVAHIAAVAEVLVDVIAKYGDWIAAFFALRSAASILADIRAGFIALSEAVGLLKLVELAEQIKMVNLAFSLTTIGAFIIAVIYAADEIYKLIGIEKQLAEQEKALNDTHKQSAEAQEHINGQLKELSDRTGVNITTQKQLNDMVKAGTLIWNENTHQWELSAQGVKKYNTAAHDAQVVTSKLNIEDVFRSGASGVAELGKQMTAAANSPDWHVMRDVIQKISDDLNKISGEDLQKFRDNVQDGFRTGALSAQQYAIALEQSVSAAEKKLGIDIKQVMTGVSATTRDAIAELNILATDGSVPGNVIAAGFNKAVAAAKNLSDMSALTDGLQEVQDQGTATGDALDEAFRSVGVKAVDVFYKELKAATDEYQLNQLRDKLTQLFDAGTIGSKQYEESLADLNSRMKEVAVTEGMTHDELIAYNKAQQDAKQGADARVRSLEQQVKAEDSTAQAVDNYNGKLVKSTEDNEDFKRALDAASDSQQEQKRLADEHARSLAQEARQMQDSAKAEEVKLEADQRQLALLRQQLQAEQARLAAMKSSGSATQAQIMQQEIVIQRLTAAVQAAQQAVNAQEQVAAAADDAAQALSSEAASADKTAASYGSLSGAADTTARSMRSTGDAARSSSESVSTFIYSGGVFFDQLSQLSTKAAESLSKLTNGFFKLGYQASRQIDLSSLQSVSAALSDINAKMGHMDDYLIHIYSNNIDLQRAMGGMFTEVNRNTTLAMQAIKDTLQEAKAADTLVEQLKNLDKQIADSGKAAALPYEKITAILNSVQGASKGVTLSLESFIAKSETAVKSMKLLDQSQLDNLKQAIQDAKDKLYALAQQALDAKAQLSDMDKALQQSLWEQEGNQVALENQRYQDQLDKLKELHDKAGAAGDAEYQDALAKAKKLHDEKMAEIEAQHKQTMDNIIKEKEAASPSAGYIPSIFMPAGPPGPGKEAASPSAGYIPSIFIPNTADAGTGAGQEPAITTTNHIFESLSNNLISRADALASRFADKSAALAKDLVSKADAAAYSKTALPGQAGQVVHIKFQPPGGGKEVTGAFAEPDVQHFLDILARAGAVAA